MKIGIYKDTLKNKRGADVAVANLAAGLKERGHEAVLFEKGELKARAAEKWDVMVITGTNELLDLAEEFPEKFPWPTVMQFHTNPSYQFKWKRWRRNLKIKRALRSVQAIQILREAFRGQVEKYGTKVETIGNFSMMESKNAGESEKTIIYPAAWNKDKNQPMLIQAFEKARKQFPEWTLELYGGGKVPEKLPDGVKAMGFCDLTEAYGKCAFVAFPSLDEGFGLVIADAAKFGKPCVMVEDWIGTVKAGGGVLTGKRAGAYAEGLKKLMGDAAAREAMGAKAREFCDREYSRVAILDKWERLLKEVVNGR